MFFILDDCLNTIKYRWDIDFEYSNKQMNKYYSNLIQTNHNRNDYIYKIQSHVTITLYYLSILLNTSSVLFLSLSQRGWKLLTRVIDVLTASLTLYTADVFVELGCRNVETVWTRGSIVCSRCFNIAATKSMITSYVNNKNKLGWCTVVEIYVRCLSLQQRENTVFHVYAT